MKYMTVKELKELLKNEDEESIVVLSNDEEGNSFSPLQDYGLDNFLPDGNYGEIYPRELTKDLIEKGYTEEDLGSKENRKKMVKCITLYPLN